MRCYAETLRGLIAEADGRFSDEHYKGDKYGRKVAMKVARQEANILLDSHLFQMDEEITEALLQTENETRKVPLPFKACFLEAEIESQGWTYHGVLIYENKRVEDGEKTIMFRTIGTQPVEGDDERVWWTTLRGDLVDALELTREYGQHWFYEEGEVFEEGEFEEDERLRAIILNFVMNWYDLINEPKNRVFVRGIAESDSGRRRRREKYGVKPPRKLSQVVIKAGTDLKEYIYDEQSWRKESRDVQKHWVRGHWRHLRSKYYGEKRGQRIWIPPHTRGKGVLVKKPYEVEKEDNDEST